MVSRGDDDDRERPSWREIDRRRDRSRHTSRGESSSTERTLRSKWAKQQYLKEAEKLFQGPKGGKEHQQALEAIHRAYGTKRFHKAVQSYLEQYDLPSDWATLLLLLDYQDHQVVTRVMTALAQMASSRSLMERQALKDKLEILSLTAASSEVTAAAEALLAQL